MKEDARIGPDPPDSNFQGLFDSSQLFQSSTAEFPEAAGPFHLFQSSNDEYRSRSADKPHSNED